MRGALCGLSPSSVRLNGGGGVGELAEGGRGWSRGNTPSGLEMASVAAFALVTQLLRALARLPRAPLLGLCVWPVSNVFSAASSPTLPSRYGSCRPALAQVLAFMSTNRAAVGISFTKGWGILLRKLQDG